MDPAIRGRSNAIVSGQPPQASKPVVKSQTHVGSTTVAGRGTDAETLPVAGKVSALRKQFENPEVLENQNVEVHAKQHTASRNAPHVPQSLQKTPPTPLSHVSSAQSAPKAKKTPTPEEARKNQIEEMSKSMPGVIMRSRRFEADMPNLYTFRTKLFDESPHNEALFAITDDGNLRRIDNGPRIGDKIAVNNKNPLDAIREYFRKIDREPGEACKKQIEKMIERMPDRLTNEPSHEDMPNTFMFKIKLPDRPQHNGAIFAVMDDGNLMRMRDGPRYGNRIQVYGNQIEVGDKDPLDAIMEYFKKIDGLL